MKVMLIAIFAALLSAQAFGQTSIPRTAGQSIMPTSNFVAGGAVNLTASNIGMVNTGFTNSILPGEVSGLPQLGGGFGYSINPQFYGNYYYNSHPFPMPYGNGFFANRGNIDCSGAVIAIYPNPCSGQTPMYTPPSYYQGNYFYNNPFYQYNPSFNGNFYSGSPFYQGYYLGNPLFGNLGQQPARFTQGIADSSRYSRGVDAFGNQFYISNPAPVNSATATPATSGNGTGVTILQN